MPKDGHYPNVKVRPGTKDKIKDLADACRIDQLELVEVAVDAFGSLPEAEQNKFIRHPKRRPKTQSA